MDNGNVFGYDVLFDAGVNHDVSFD
jgi:hypothetical protein